MNDKKKLFRTVAIRRKPISLRKLVELCRPDRPSGADRLTPDQVKFNLKDIDRGDDEKAWQGDKKALATVRPDKTSTARNPTRHNKVEAPVDARDDRHLDFLVAASGMFTSARVLGDVGAFGAKALAAPRWWLFKPMHDEPLRHLKAWIRCVAGGAEKFIAEAESDPAVAGVGPAEAAELEARWLVTRSRASGASLTEISRKAGASRKVVARLAKRPLLKNMLFSAMDGDCQVVNAILEKVHGRVFAKIAAEKQLTPKVIHASARHLRDRQGSVPGPRRPRK